MNEKTWCAVVVVVGVECGGEESDLAVRGAMVTLYR